MPESEAESGPASDADSTEWRKASRFYRRPLGLAWLIGLVLVPLLLAVIGNGMLDRSRLQTGGEPSPGGALPTLIEPGAGAAPAPPAGLALAPLSITRSPDGVTLTGDLPDPAVKQSLLDAVIGAMGEDVNVFDNLTVTPGVKALDVANTGPFFEAASTIPDFSLTVDGDTVTLSGTAAKANDVETVADAAVAAWPNVNIVNKISVKGAPLPPAPLAILRNGNVVTVNGDLPDVAAKAALLGMLMEAFGPGVNFVETLNLKPGIGAPNLPGMAALFKAAHGVPDFKFKIAGDEVALSGTAESAAMMTAIEEAATSAWPGLNIIDDMQVGAASSTAAPAPGTGCQHLQTEITDLMRTPVVFTSDGATLAPDSQQQLTRVADKLKACPPAHVAVNGYTDNTGGDAINVPLSTRRAQSVAAFLVAQGVAADRVTAKGFGSAGAIAGNDTPDGRAKNRRVEIVVS